jgi:hypothetical protein
MVRRRRRSRLRIGLPAALILAAGALLVLRQLATYKPEGLPPVTVVQAAQARRAVTQAKDTVTEVSKAAARGQRVPFRVQVKADDLTTYASSDKKIKRQLAAKGFRDPRFRFEDGSVTVSGFMNYKKREVYVTVSGKPKADIAGRVRFSNVSVQIGKLSAPMLAARAQKVFDQAFSSGDARLPANVRQITAQNGQLSVNGVSRPE